MRRARLVFIVSLCLLAVATCPAVAQAQLLTGYTDGYEAGRIAAKTEIRSTAPFMGGLFLGVFYVGYSVLADGQMPPFGRIQALQGSDDYKRGYLEGYQKEWQSIRTKNALFGWGTSVAFWLLLYSITIGMAFGY